jgi:hypothetical protein
MKPTTKEDYRCVLHLPDHKLAGMSLHTGDGVSRDISCLKEHRIDGSAGKITESGP